LAVTKVDPRRYEIGSDGRIVLVGLNSDETLEFELLDQSISGNNDPDEFTGQQSSVARLLDWLELYHKQHEATNQASLETDPVFANDPSPLRAIQFDQSSPARLRLQRAQAVRRTRVTIVAMALSGIVILFVAGVALII
jgi:hypothetical protein